MVKKSKYAVIDILISLSVLIIFTNISLIKNYEIIKNDYSPWVYAYGHHNTGNFWVTIWNTMEEGNVDQQPYPDRYYGVWPAGSGDEYLYHSQIWIAWKDSVGNIYVISSYAIGSEKEWVPIDYAENHMWMSNENGWPPDPSIETVSDLDGITKCNDSGATENGPIGLELVRHSYQWGVPGHYDWIVYHYYLKNVSRHTLDKLYIAWFYDCDVGGSIDYIDDLVGYEGNDNTDEWTNPTEPGEPWTNKTPDGIPDEYDAVNYEPPETRGTSYMYDSNHDYEGYIAVRPFGYFGDWPDGEFIKPSSHHIIEPNEDCISNDIGKYQLMTDINVYEETESPYDWEMLPAIGPLKPLNDNETIDFYTVCCMGDGLLDLRRNLDQVLADWLGNDRVPGTDDDWIIEISPNAPRLVLIPGDSKICVHWSREYASGKNLENEPDPHSGIVDFDGYILWRSAVGFDKGWVAVAWWDKYTSDTEHCYKPFGWRNTSNPDLNKEERIPDGLDDKTHSPSLTEPDLRFAKQFTYEYDLLPQLDETLYYHFDDDGAYPENDPYWTDYRLKNGFRYYYAMSSYDFGSDRSGEHIFKEPIISGRIENQTSSVPEPGSSQDLSKVWVVPNPYIGSADWELWSPSLVRENKIAFMNLPGECTIDIYTLAGEWVDRIEYNDEKYGAAYWDLSNYSRSGRPGLRIASGVYIFRVSTPSGGEYIGKFAIILGSDEKAD